MWDILADQGYLTYSARDMCSRCHTKTPLLRLFGALSS